MKLILAVLFSIYSTSSLSWSGQWDENQHKMFFDKLEACKSTCADFCPETLSYASEIIKEYSSVCFDGNAANYDYFHYCGYQCTNVCRTQTQAIMKSAILENSELCR